MPRTAYLIDRTELIEVFKMANSLELNMFNTRSSQNINRHKMLPYVDLEEGPESNSFYLYLFEKIYCNNFFQIESFIANNGQLYYGTKNLTRQPPHLVFSGNTYGVYPLISGEFSIQSRYYTYDDRNNIEILLFPSEYLFESYKKISRLLKSFSKRHLQSKANSNSPAQ